MTKIFDPSLYLVTDNQFNKNLNVIEIVTQAALGGVTMVQLRAKKMSQTEIKELGKALLQMLKPKKIPLIINDFVEIAKEIGADGVHLGINDVSPSRAREILGHDFIIGLSIENTDALNAIDIKNVDYIAASPVFPTFTKQNTAKPFLIEGLKSLRKLSNLPLLAIGGIHQENIKQVMQAGADGIAIVSAICGAFSPKNASAELKSLVEKYKGRKE